MTGKLVLQDGAIFEGEIFGAQNSIAGELVFSTGMMGYPESLTDPSYKGQILVLTYPLIGNYGVPDRTFWESDKIMVQGLVVSNYIDTPSHYQSQKTLSQWFKDEGLPIIQIKDTRFLAQTIRDKGALLAKIIINKNISYYDPNKINLMEEISINKISTLGNGKKKILLIDCGAKKQIQKCLLKRNVTLTTTSWDFNPFKDKIFPYDGIVISNGPGDPKFAAETIKIIKKALSRNIPTLGICLGHQLLALAAGGDTKKLKYGHRSQNQPAILEGSDRCYITTQNHGFYVSKIPTGFKVWFTNANDQTNEGIIHQSKPFMSVQFHPEATPGPTDTEWIFDYFLKRIMS